MCRWLAYSGPPLPQFVDAPDHSLIDQSRHATQNIATTNGDGFGVGSYGQEETPGVYRNTHPAWNDVNFGQLSEQSFAAVPGSRPRGDWNARVDLHAPPEPAHKAQR